MKNALVTGGTKGIGYAIARMLLSEGYHVTVTYSNDEEAAENCKKLLRATSNNFDIIKADQANKTDMRQLVVNLRMKQHIDCIVCNAGTTLRNMLTDITDEEWERVMMVNVNAPLYLIRDICDCIPHGSRIIFIGSEMGIYPHGTSLAYGVTKSAVHALTKNLVKFFEGTDTTVNAIAPGFVETEWQKDKPQEIRQNIINKTAIKRFATPDEVADAAKFCISNAFVNGSVIEVSGGYCYK